MRVTRLCKYEPFPIPHGTHYTYRARIFNWLAIKRKTPASTLKVHWGRRFCTQSLRCSWTGERPFLTLGNTACKYHSVAIKFSLSRTIGAWKQSWIMNATMLINNEDDVHFSSNVHLAFLIYSFTGYASYYNCVHHQVYYSESLRQETVRLFAH